MSRGPLILAAIGTAGIIIGTIGHTVSDIRWEHHCERVGGHVVRHVCVSKDGRVIEP